MDRGIGVTLPTTRFVALTSAGARMNTFFITWKDEVITLVVGFSHGPAFAVAHGTNRLRDYPF